MVVAINADVHTTVTPGKKSDVCEYQFKLRLEFSLF